MSLTLKPKSLTIDAIESSPEIQAWLSQFPAEQRITAKMMLCRLKFISRDAYSSWLKATLSSLPKDQIHALYSVRKLDSKKTELWDNCGEIVKRPGKSLGSEDLVYSLIANTARTNPRLLLDHPSIKNLRNQKVQNYILIDDSIGSGDRVSKFINAMLKNPTFLSWWSFGYVKIHVISFARPRESELVILTNVRGSDHGKRKYRKSSKISFTSKLVYSTSWLETRWGESYRKILDLCNNTTKIDKKWRRGYGSVMANIVFYHSVPNNLPGMLWLQNEEWNALFPGRTLPDWLPPLLEQHSKPTPLNKQHIPEDIIRLLILIKQGIRSTQTISDRLNCDHQFSLALLAKARELKLLTDQSRLTVQGFNYVKNLEASNTLPTWDTSLYIPSSWCAG